MQIKPGNINTPYSCPKILFLLSPKAIVKTAKKSISVTTGENTV
jgi:hypothetical protein